VLQQAEKDSQFGATPGVSENNEGKVTGEVDTRVSTASTSPRFEDHRHNLVLWARPPQRLRDVVGECQRRLREIVPGE